MIGAFLITLIALLFELLGMPVSTFGVFVGAIYAVASVELYGILVAAVLKEKASTTILVLVVAAKLLLFVGLVFLLIRLGVLFTLSALVGLLSFLPGLFGAGFKQPK